MPACSALCLSPNSILRSMTKVAASKVAGAPPARSNISHAGSVSKGQPARIEAHGFGLIEGRRAGPRGCHCGAREGEATHRPAQRPRYRRDPGAPPRPFEVPFQSMTRRLPRPLTIVAAGSIA